jgi:osmotically-inducible protein OsmY
MHRIGRYVAGVLFAVAGCSHTSTVKEQASSTWSQAKGGFASAYDSVKAGTQRAASSGKYAMQGIGQGAVRVTETTKETAKQGGKAVSDGWITSKIKSKYAWDKDVKMTRISVDTDRGVVRLTGNVENEQAAQRAIDLALDTKGVSAVDSQLQFPSGTNESTPPPGGPM